jgi:hypothetical protein
VLDLTRQQNAPAHEALARHQLVVPAHVLPVQAAAHSQQALTQPCGRRPLVAYGHWDRGMLEAATGQRELARPVRSVAMARCHVMAMTCWLPADGGSVGARGGAMMVGEGRRDAACGCAPNTVS